MRRRTALLYLALAACSRKEEPLKARTEPWQNPAFQEGAASSAAPSASAAASEHYALERADVRFALATKEQTTRGRIAAASGELRLAQGKLAETRATLDVDLTTLTIDADGDAESQSAYTRRALEWLEVGPALPAATRDRHRGARFELTGLERLTPGKNPGAWQATARGQLSLHGFRVPVEQPIAVELGSNTITVRSLRPLVIKLGEHDLRPRNEQGQIVSSELSLLGTRIGREAKVDFELEFAARAIPENSD